MGLVESQNRQLSLLGAKTARLILSDRTGQLGQAINDLKQDTPIDTALKRLFSAFERQQAIARLLQKQRQG